MSEKKFIDLAPQIASMHDQHIGTIRVVLGLLDQFTAEHTDQVPGRTITESEFREACEYEDQAHRAASPHTYAERVMFALGIKIVTDPPPHHRGSAADVEHHWPGCGHE